MKRINLMILSLAASLLGCDTDTELRKSIFIADKDNPGLPQYSEWGYNTFGAYYDRVPFTSNYHEAPSKFLVQDQNTVFTLRGSLNGYDPLFVGFTLPDFTPETFSDLVSLHNTTLDLNETMVTLSQYDDNVPLEILEGSLTFNRAQTLIVDGKLTEVILSGHFEFKALLNGTPVTISEGRFDLGIGQESFYYLN